MKLSHYQGSGEVFEAGAGWFSKVRIQRFVLVEKMLFDRLSGAAV